MKECNLLFNKVLKVAIFLPIIFTRHAVNAQECSMDAMAAKYWQYRESFNKHFILVDRDSSGCVNDGIGQIGNTCGFQKAGYSLPATSITMSTNGHAGLADKERGVGDIFEDLDCAEGDDDNPNTSPISWNNSKHNYLEVGSETPHQMGWYWATLATEYELLKRNGQLQEAQRTLEELFLGLQAYRRLDMQAQCMVRKRYDEITADFEVETCGSWVSPQLQVTGDCLCGAKYTDGHPNFDNPCEDICDYPPDLSGYSGFFLREDATQGLEILHDSSEDRYNIDLVSSAYAMSLAPPCTSDFSQPCYLVHTQNFMSQDGMTGLMIGLALIKRYIPEDAEVVTCDGTIYKPLLMAKKITSAIIDRVDDAYRNRISWPGSPGCCAKETFLSNGEGGQLQATITGFKHAADYIDGQHRHSSAGEWFAWSTFSRATAQVSAFDNNAKFWLRLKALGWDMGEERHATKTLFHSAASTQNVEVLILINNLLYPQGENLSTNREFFEELLCKAPCGGPCYKQQGYGGQSPMIWPDFDCPNEPEWFGQRWETHGFGENRLFNGLDYLALFNIYMLHYNVPANQYFNPERHTGNVSFGSGTLINGPDKLCPVNIGNYEIQHVYQTPSSPSFLSDITWTTSTNLEVLVPSQSQTNIRANAGMNPSFIKASYIETKQHDQHSPAPLNPILPLHLTLQPNGETVDENCFFSVKKPIVTTSDAYYFTWEFDACNGEYCFHAQGGVATGVIFNWTFEVLGTSTQITAQGKDPCLNSSQIPASNGASLVMRVTLTTTSDCGSFLSVNYIYYICYGNGLSLRVSPNPAQDQVAITVVQGEGSSPYNLTDPEGLRIRVTPANGGATLIDTRIYANEESISASNLQNGVYNLEASAPSLSAPLNTVLVIAR